MVAAGCFVPPPTSAYRPPTLTAGTTLRYSPITAVATPQDTLYSEVSAATAFQILWGKRLYVCVLASCRQVEKMISLRENELCLICRKFWDFPVLGFSLTFRVARF